MKQELIINTSPANFVTVNIFDYDNIPLSAIYNDKSNNSPINLTPWKFRFILKEKDSTVKEYLIEAGQVTSEFLSKIGDSVNTLNMQLMWQDIRDNQIASPSIVYRLIQVVTDDEGKTYTHIDYTINEQKY